MGRARPDARAGPPHGAVGAPAGRPRWRASWSGWTSSSTGSGLRCPWDRSQSHGSLARHLLEETYEALDAIEAVAATEPDVAPEAMDHLAEELGDLLFQVCFHAVLAAEEGRFTLADVARGVHDKLVARHPHVFGDVVADTPEDVAAAWEARKLHEKGRSSVTEGIPVGPAGAGPGGHAAGEGRVGGPRSSGSGPAPARDRRGCRGAASREWPRRRG